MNRSNIYTVVAHAYRCKSPLTSRWTSYYFSKSRVTTSGLDQQIACVSWHVYHSHVTAHSLQSEDIADFPEIFFRDIALSILYSILMCICRQFPIHPSFWYLSVATD